MDAKKIAIIHDGYYTGYTVIEFMKVKHIYVECPK